MENKETYTDFISMKNKIVDTIVECVMMYGTDEPSVVSYIGSMATAQFFSDNNINLLKTKIAEAGSNAEYTNSVIISTISSALYNTSYSYELSLTEYIYQFSVSYRKSLNIIHEGSTQLFVTDVLNIKESENIPILMGCFAINVFYKDILKGIKNAKNK